MVDPRLGKGIVNGLSLIGLSLGAIAAATVAKSATEIAEEQRDRHEDRRDREWERAWARTAIAQALSQQRSTIAPGWYDDGSGYQRWWNGQGWSQHVNVQLRRVSPPAGWYDVGPGRKRWWDGQGWTDHYASLQTGQRQLAPAVEPRGVGVVARGRPRITMTRAEWQERMRAMLLGQSFSEEHWELLSNAQIEDADDALIEWQSELRKLTPHQFSELVNQSLEMNPDA